MKNGFYNSLGYCTKITGEWHKVKADQLRRQCEGKIPYKTFEKADRVAFRMTEQEGDDFHAYYCENCTWFHVAHTYPAYVRNGSRRQMKIQYKAEDIKRDNRESLHDRRR